jgi:hypothetical protein
MPPYEIRAAMVDAYDARLEADDALWDLEVGNALGMVLQHKCCAFGFAEALVDLLERAAPDAAARRDVVAVGAVALFHEAKCEKTGAWSRPLNRCVPKEAAAEASS